MPTAYLKLGDLNGESTDARFKGWIPVESFSLGQSNAGGGGSGGVQQNSTYLTEITVTKNSDRTSADLMKAIAMGQHFDHAILCIMGMPGGTVGSALLMESVLIAGLNFSGGGGGSRPMESLLLNFRTMTRGTVADYSAPHGPASPAVRKKQPAPPGRTAGSRQPGRP